jgi:long-chain fatty acid transport protein
MKTQASLLKIMAAAFCALVILSLLRADDSNYQRFMVGDRAAGMGGAVVSIAEGVDACYYNPAGLGKLKANTLSISANLYGFDYYSVKDAWFPSEDFKSSSFISIPTTMGSLFKLGEHEAALAFSVFIPDKTTLHEISAFTDLNHYTTYSKDDQALWLGPSVGGNITPQISVGLSVFGVYRTFSEFESIYWASEPTTLSLSQDIKAYTFNLASVWGIQLHPTKEWNVGLTYQTPQFSIVENGEAQYQYIIAKTNSSYFYADDLTVKNDVPMRLTFGVGQDVTDVYAWGVDLTWHLPTSFTSIEGRSNLGTNVTERIQRKAVADVNVGGEYIILKKFPVRAGFFTSFSSAPAVDVKDNTSLAQINEYGLTCSVGRRSNILDANVGVNYLFGSGEDLGYDIDEKGNLVRKVVDASERRIYLFFNTSYHF